MEISVELLEDEICYYDKNVLILQNEFKAADWCTEILMTIVDDCMCFFFFFQFFSLKK